MAFREDLERLLRLPDRPTLFNARNSQPEPAKIIELTPRVAREKIDGGWKAVPGISKEALAREPDSQWSLSWERIAEMARDAEDFVCVACQVSADTSIQGVILYDIGGRSFRDPEIPAVQPLLLATAPMNRVTLAPKPVYRGVGSSLLLYSVAHSFKLGLKGRTVLESEPAEATVAFYENRGFQWHSRALSGKIQMELEPLAALEWLQAAGIIK